MSAQRLRDAAKVLRERAEAVPSDWEAADFNEGADRPLWGVANDAFFNPPAHDDEPWLAVEVHTGNESTARYIATMHPGVALALADWLDSEANTCDATNYYRHPHLSGGLKRSPHLDAARIADEILGAES